MKVQFSLAREPAPKQEAEGRRLFAKRVSFLKGVVEVSELPTPDRIEVCFAGRSNVGKSSLINSLTNRKSLARTSNMPGRTREINYFCLEDRYYLVDLPGYGYANAPLNIVKKWQGLIREYLAGRQSLRRAFVLIDFRHGIKPIDSQIMDLMDFYAVPFQCILTKADKVKRTEQKIIIDKVESILQKHPAAFPELVVTSSEKGMGIATLRSIVAELDDSRDISVIKNS